MATVKNDPVGDADTLFASGIPDATQFWNSAASIVSSKGYSPADAMAFLNEARNKCNNAFTRSYQLPPAESGRSITTPFALFGEWCVYLLADMFTAEAENDAAGHGISGGFSQLAKLTTANAQPLRLDAAIDVARVAVSWYNSPTNLPLFPSPIPPLPSQAGGKWEGFLEQGLNTAGMLAFAVPTAGPVLGGVLQAASSLLKVFLPGPNPVQQAEAILTNKVLTALENQTIQSAKTSIDVASGFLVDLINNLNDPAITSLQLADMADWFTEQAEQITLTHKPAVLSALETLGSDDAVVVPGVIEALVYGISTYLALLRQKVVFDLTLAAIAQQIDPEDLQGALENLGKTVGDFVDFRQAVVGEETAPVPQSSTANWACQLNNYLFQMVAGRLTQIQMNWVLVPLITIEDEGTPKGTTKTVGKLDPPHGLSGKSAIATMKMQACYDYLEPYVASVAQALDTSYDQHFQCIGTWISSIDQWAQMLPVETPDWSPVIQSWTAASPQGSVWIDGTQVRYAVCYANAQCESPQGPWSAPAAVSGQAYPVLQLQVDPVGSASCYYVLRQIKPPGGSGWNGIQYVGVPDMPPTTSGASTTWTDTDAAKTGSTAG